jgi:hypothetical protein
MGGVEAGQYVVELGGSGHRHMRACGGRRITDNGSDRCDTGRGVKEFGREHTWHGRMAQRFITRSRWDISFGRPIIDPTIRGRRRLLGAVRQ